MPFNGLLELLLDVLEVPLEALDLLGPVLEAPGPTITDERTFSLIHPLTRRPGTLDWDSYKDSPMLELCMASTRNLVEPQVPD